VRTLFVPERSRGFVSPAEGSLSLRRILVPVAERPDPQLAVESAAWVAEALGVPPVAIHVLHVGEAPPALELPKGDGWIWHRITRPGDPVEEILTAAEELPADLLVMTTDGRDVFIDAFRGSHVERVVRRATCPVVALPVPKGT
jgi:nucleotide-binding universal stress UspA family protein